MRFRLDETSSPCSRTSGGVDHQRSADMKGSMSVPRTIGSDDDDDRDEPDTSSYNREQEEKSRFESSVSLSSPASISTTSSSPTFPAALSSDAILVEAESTLNGGMSHATRLETSKPLSGFSQHDDDDDDNDFSDVRQQQQVDDGDDQPHNKPSAAPDPSGNSNDLYSSHDGGGGGNSSVLASAPSIPAGVIEDDDGGDHAEEPGVTWKPQNMPSTCEFTHIIGDYAQKRESGCKKAEYSEITVDEFGNRWRLIIYVNGNGRASNHHLSLFLQVADAEELPFGWKKSVSYVLTLEHPSGGNLSYAKRNPDKTFKLCPKAIDWGWSQFITSDRIQQEGFVSNDTLTVKAFVTVKSSSVSIDEEDAELYLKCAAEEGDAEAVKLCLEQGASVNCKFKDDLYTPLHTACSSGTSAGSMEVLNLLLENKADCNACNKWRETPLLIAANNGHRLAVEALLKHGADPSMCSEAGWSALTFAAHKGYEDIVELLLNAGASANCPVTEDCSTPLHKACAGSKPGHLASIKLLLEHGVDVHALNKWRETPLLTAANHGQAGAVEALLKAGADPCKCTDTGWSPLSIAAYKGHDDVVRLLLEEGAPTEEDDPTLSALLQAATKGLPDTVELLLRHGADHTVTTKKGDTALSILVEQNLIDAAVEMVTEYNASIPRCSRDRKKVQRARLLINHRMKKLGKEGKGGNASTDDSESDGDESHYSKQAQQMAEALSSTSSKISAEEKAKAAAEALLKELEQEDAEAKKVEAEANSKRAKKRKKKERERQLKQKEEQDRREREEYEAQEQERLKKEKDDKLRREREMRQQEEQEREIKEALEQEKLLLTKRKEREDREKLVNKERTEPSKKSTAVAVQASGTADKRGAPNTAKTKKTNGVTGISAPLVNVPSKLGMNGHHPHPLGGPQPAGNRRWETSVKSKSPLKAQTKRQVAPISVDPIPPVPLGQSPLDESRSSNTKKPTTFKVSPRIVQVSSSTPDAAPILVSAAPVHQEEFKTQPAPQDKLTSAWAKGKMIEHPAVSLFRQEKVLELLQRCQQSVSAVNVFMIKRVLYRWIIRAAHDKAERLDPIIPSWVDTDSLVTFFQRQFISEARRGSSVSSLPNMEAMKETGSAVALFCLAVAQEVVEFRHRILDQHPQDWTDAVLGLTASDVTLNGNGSVVTISMASRKHLYLPSLTFASLRDRYVGAPTRFLAAVFAAKIMYETTRLVVADTGMDLRLSQATQACMAAETAASAELWSTPFSALNNNVFWGTLEEADSFFGGQTPFSRESKGGEDVLASCGGSVIAFLPFDNMVASRYVQRMVDILDKASPANVPVSFAFMAHSESFHDLRHSPNATSLEQLDPRLSKEKRWYIRRVEVLAAGQHCFNSGDGVGSAEICRNSSLFVVLQNDPGFSRFLINDAAVGIITESMAAHAPAQTARSSALSPFAGEFKFRQSSSNFSNRYFQAATVPSTPDPPRTVHSDVSSFTGSSSCIPQAFSPVGDPMHRGSRRGRLFDLVDNVEEDYVNEVDIVSGMLNNLDVGLFQNNTYATDVDIEAISLMGIGGPPTTTLHPRNAEAGRFG